MALQLLWKSALGRVVGYLDAKGLLLVVLGCMAGAASGVIVTAMGRAVQELHIQLFSLPVGMHLSGMVHLSSAADALVPVFGGMLLGVSALLVRRYRNRSLVDPIEANALYGGRMSFNDTLIVAAQTMASSGFGASVGLEAGYTQVGSGLASKVGQALNLRRADMRLLVGCGAAGAIAAAFGAPLTGAFYGFELIIGVYTVANVAPVMAAAISASLVGGLLGAPQFPISIGAVPAIVPHQYLPIMILGLLCALVSIAIMQLVSSTERFFSYLRIPPALRPVVGGCFVGGLGLITPQVLSSGHGAMGVLLASHFAAWTLASAFALKLLASAISLGSGFRGGLFFASLLLGALLGKFFAAIMWLVMPDAAIHSTVAAVIGMTSLAVGIVGGPLTMTFLALEATKDLGLTGLVLSAALVSSLVVRIVFGYSFSTWRLHLRGETIRSAHDVGWMRNLTVRSMMRTEVRTVDENTSAAAFKKMYPLGSAQRVVLVRDDKVYAGIVQVPDAYSGEIEDESAVVSLAKFPDTVLIPPMNAKAAAGTFDAEKAEELAVVDSFRTRRVVGILTEGHLMRRYAEELEKARLELSGEGE